MKSIEKSMKSAITMQNRLLAGWMARLSTDLFTGKCRRAPFFIDANTFDLRSRSVGGVGRCSWGLGPSPHDGRHAGRG